MTNWALKVFAYDKDKKFLEEYVGYQYRDIKYHKDTQFIRVVGLAPSDSVDTNLCLVHFIRPINCVSRNLTVTESRGTGGAWNGMNNCLFENIDMICCGSHVTPVGFDFEDGWDQMQDTTIRNMNFYNRPGTADLMTCAGQNFILEDMKEGSWYVYGRTRNIVIRNCTCTADLRFLHEGNLKSGTYRVYNSNLQSIAVANEGSSCNYYNKNAQMFYSRMGGKVVKTEIDENDKRCCGNNNF